MIAFDEGAYGEMVLHPPPVSYLSTLLIPFIWHRTLMRFVTTGFSYLMHWVENLIFLMSFIMFEAMLAPLTYLKVWINVITSSLGLLKTIMNSLVWAALGVPMIFYIIMRDTTYLMKILCYH